MIDLFVKIFKSISSKKVKTKPSRFKIKSTPCGKIKSKYNQFIFDKEVIREKARLPAKENKGDN